MSTESHRRNSTHTCKTRGATACSSRPDIPGSTTTPTDFEPPVDPLDKAPSACRCHLGYHIYENRQTTLVGESLESLMFWLSAPLALSTPLLPTFSTNLRRHHYHSPHPCQPLLIVEGIYSRAHQGRDGRQELRHGGGARMNARASGWNA